MQTLKDNFEKSGGIFKKFKIGDLFEIKKGVRLTKSNMKPGTIRFVGSSAENNGITHFIENNDHLHSANTITVCYNGSVGEAFYQDEKFWASDDVNVLYFKENKINKEISLYFIALIKKLKNRYSYNFKWTTKRMKEDTILVPVVNNKIAYLYIEQYVREVEAERVREVEAYLTASGLNDSNLLEKEKQVLKLRPRYKYFGFSDVFEKAKTGNYDIQRMHVNGKGCFYINSGVENQGIVGMTDIDATIFPPETITIDMFGLAWYRDFEYKLATHAHVFSFKPLQKLSQNCLLYLVATMFYLKSKYNYNNMCSPKKLSDDRLCLPVDENGNIDYQYIEDYIAAIKKLIITDLVKWKDRELNAYKMIAS